MNFCFLDHVSGVHRDGDQARVGYLTKVVSYLVISEYPPTFSILLSRDLVNVIFIFEYKESFGLINK